MKRAALVGLATALLTVAWLAPLPKSFASHMVVHMTVVACAAPLLAFGMAGTRLDPVALAPNLFPPIPLSVLELLAVWGWHAPAPHHWARHSAAGLALEQITFLVAGMLVWLSAFGGTRDRREERSGAGVVAMLLTSMHMTLLGALLALASRPLYVHGGQVPAEALNDQHVGGAIMLLVGGVAYLAGGLWLTVGLLQGWSASSRQEISAGSARLANPRRRR